MSPRAELTDECCTECGKFTGGEPICPYCGADLETRSELEEVDEEELEQGGSILEDDEPLGGPVDQDEEE